MMVRKEERQLKRPVKENPKLRIKVVAVYSDYHCWQCGSPSLERTIGLMSAAERHSSVYRAFGFAIDRRRGNSKQESSNEVLFRTKLPASSMAKQPRKRLLNACDECRKRKVRCDSATIAGDVCSECLKWNAECTHDMPNKKRGPKAGFSRRSRVHKSDLRHIISSIVDLGESYTLPEDLDFVRTLVIDLAVQVRSLEVQLKAQERNQVKLSRTLDIHRQREINVSEGADDTVALASRFEELLAIDGKRHYGGSSTFQLVRNALRAKGEISGGVQPSIKVDKLKRTVPEWQAPLPSTPSPFTFPADDLLHTLVDLYFSNVEPYFPMLHRKTFERSLSDGVHLTDRRFGALLLMLCTLASQHSDDPRTLSDGVPSEHSKGWKYFRQIQLVHEIQESPSIYEFQLYPLASFFLHTTNVSSTAFFLVAIGIRAAHQKGVHEQHFAIADNPIETELWRRAFWCLIVFDVYASITLGRPQVTSLENLDANYPQDFDDEPRDGDPGMLPQHLSKSPSLAFWIHYLQLFQIMGLSNRAFYSVNASYNFSASWDGLHVSSAPEWEQKTLVELDTALNNWVDSIPRHLWWDPQRQNETLLRQSSMLYATYYWAQFQVHKPFISRSSQFGEPLSSSSSSISSSPTFLSVTICANSARSLIDLVDSHYRQRPFVALPLLIGPLFDSAIVLLINLWRGLQIHPGALDPAKELADVRRCIALLEMYEKRYQAASRLCEILNSIISVNLPVTTPERDGSTLKRARTLSDSASGESPEDEGDEVNRRGSPRKGNELGSSGSALDSKIPSGAGGGADIEIGNAGNQGPALDPVAAVHFENDANSSHGSCLPYHSYELSRLPLHIQSIGAPGSMNTDAPNPEDDPFGTEAFSWASAGEMYQNQQSEDWNSFMADIDNLLQSVQTAGEWSSDFYT
ncbi:fungal-specific transcription factor domain-containing protein [Lentinula raphanica]|nr:fungal-specific transcription factor domain-containing protein [Lentinula raphanica]